MRPLACTWLLLLATSLGAAGHKAPAGTRKFNIACPAKELLPKVDLAYHRCNNGRRDECGQFVTLLRQTLPKYDCQRPFDQDYVVPVLWLADAAMEDYVRLLSRLPSLEASRLFASQEFREVLDGDLAEEFGPLSRETERQLTEDLASCSEQLIGVVSGVVTSKDGAVPDMEVRFRMSDDATVSVRTDARGEFLIRCVYPAPTYHVCVGPKTTEQCFSIVGPRATPSSELQLR